MNADVVLAALKGLGIKNAAKSGRNDMVVDGKKVSGSAYKYKPGKRTLHHGTMLLNLDKSAANKYLNPSIAKLKSKGVDSVRSRIMNLCEVNPLVSHEKFCEAMKEAFRNKHKGRKCEEIEMREEDLHKNPEIEKIYNETSTWDWRYGETPEFSYSIEKKFDWGLVELCLNVQNGYIQEGKIYSDCLFPDFIDTFNGVLQQPKVVHAKRGWSVLADQMASMCTGNDMYLGYLKDITSQVHEKVGI